MEGLSLAIARFDLLHYVKSRGADPEGKNEWMLTCPRCNKIKLTVSVKKRRWRCFACEKYGPPGLDGKKTVLEGAGGIFQLVEWVEELSKSETARFIVNAARPPELGGGLLPDVNFNKASAVVRYATGLPENCLAVDGILPYMERRRITLHDAKAFGLGYVPMGGGWLANRLVFPVWERGTCIYWQARACWDAHEHIPRPWTDRAGNFHDDKFRKTLNPSMERNGIHFFGSGDVLGNLELAACYPRVAIVEGPTSGIRTGPDAVWTFGKQLQPAQVARLVGAGVRAVDFMWDGPSEKEPRGAWDQMVQQAAFLVPFMDVRLVFLPQGDPGTYDREHLTWMRAHALPYGAVAPKL